MLGLAFSELRSGRTLLTIAAPRTEVLKEIELPDSVLLGVGSKPRAKKPRRKKQQQSLESVPYEKVGAEGTHK